MAFIRQQVCYKIPLSLLRSTFEADSTSGTIAAPHQILMIYRRPMNPPGDEIPAKKRPISSTMPHHRMPTDTPETTPQLLRLPNVLQGQNRPFRAVLTITSRYFRHPTKIPTLRGSNSNERTSKFPQIEFQINARRPVVVPRSESTMDVKCGGLAVRRALQPRDDNVAVAPSTVVIGKAPKPKAKTRAARRPAAAVEKPRARAECGVVVGVAEVSLAEELKKARERRGRLRAVREVTQRELDGRAAALDREAAEWERRAEEQRRLVAELMRLVGMPEVSPVRPLGNLLLLRIDSIRFLFSVIGFGDLCA
jgi:hypothetical protein